MITAGILLLSAAFLCVLSIMLKSKRRIRLTYPIILLQGALSGLLFLWSLIYLIILFFFQTELTIQNLGLILFLSLLFSHITTLTVGVLLTVAIMQKLGGYFSKQADTKFTHKQWYLKLIKIHIPLALLCFLIGVWDIIYITSIHSLITNMMELS
ncbi:MAG: hypothetical protein JW822_01175 [Spirochaetales bacterium]|nr:hypothetical protein [Spirochaetales bacterium]